MAYLIVPDISHYQPALTMAYPRDFIIFKATQGTYYLDEHFAENAGVAHSLYESGHLAGAYAYHVFTGESVDSQFAKIQAALGKTPPAWLLAVMIDLESWSGTSYALKGDHSTAVNQLASKIAQWLGNTRAVWLYGNQYDLAYLSPRRDRRLPVILAAYTSELRYTQIPGAQGQQYTDGETKYPVPSIGAQPLPRFTPGLGNCDHNVFPPFPNGTALRTWIRPAPPADPIEEIMGYYKDKADFEKSLRAIVHDEIRAAKTDEVESIVNIVGNGLQALKTGETHGQFDHEKVPSLVKKGS